MIVRVPDLKDEVRQLEFLEPAADLNTRIDAGRGWNDQHFARDVAVVGELYRSGDDVHFQGSLDGEVRASCARCLDDFEWPLERAFRFVIVPGKPDDDSEDDEGIDHYVGDELDLSPLVREQALLGLEARVLCSDDCRGLCAGCGANLNREACRCGARN